MTKIRKLKLLILIPIILLSLSALNVNVIQSQVEETAFAQDIDLKDFFKSENKDISFRDYEGQLTELETEGYEPGLVTTTSLREFVIRIVNWALGFLGLLAVLVVIYGGVLYVISGGEEERTTTGKNAIKYAVIGLLIVMGSFAFVNTIISGAGGTQTTPGGSANITAGRVGSGFNATAEEVKALAIDVYGGFVNLAEATEEFKNIQSDAAKVSLDPVSLPTKSVLQSYLGSVRSKLGNLQSKIPEFSQAYVEINKIEREVERQIDTLKSFNDKTFIEIKSNSNIAYCDVEESSDLLDEVLGINPCAGMDEYYRGLFEFWGGPGQYVTSIDEDGEIDIAGSANSLRQRWRDGDFLKPVLESLRDDYLEVLAESFFRLQSINEEVGRFDSLVNGQENYERMKNAYGYDLVTYDNISSDIERINVTAKGGDNFYNMIAAWQLGPINYTPITDANYYLEIAMGYHSKYFQALDELQFVEAKLTANVIEGSAPLTVIFDALATNDPAGGSLQKENIIWDLGGTKTLAELMGGSIEYSQRPIPSANVQCDIEDLITLEDIAEQDEKVGATSQRCRYDKPGTYVAAIKIRSNEEATYAPGISVLTIKVNPPTTKIDLEMFPDSSSEPVTIMRYKEDDTLETSKRSVSATLDQAKVGIKFDASKTFADQYKWDFGNGEFTEFTGNPTATGIYDEPGNYQVKLEVLSRLGVVDRKIFTLEISELAARISDSHRGGALINTPIVFDGTGSRSDLGEIRSYKWEISPSPGQTKPEGLETRIEEGRNLSTLSHEFKYPLSYDIKLTVSNEKDDSSEDTFEGFMVTSQEPIAQFLEEVKYANQPSTVYFRGDLSYDPDGDERFLDYSWDVDAIDSKYEWLENTGPSSKNPIIKFNETGDYQVSLKVEDLLTLTHNPEFDVATKTITIDNTLDIAWGNQGGLTEILNEEGVAQISFQIKSENAVAYEIDFGDGDVESGNMDGAETITHEYSQSGKYDVVANVFNSEDENNSLKRKVFIGDGSTPIAKINVSVNDVQIFDLDEAIQISKTDVIRFDGGDSKNIDGTGRFLLYSWNFGDTNISSSKMASHSYSELSPEDPGYYEIRLKVSDKDNTALWSEDFVKIDVQNDAPTFASIQGTPRGERGDLTTPVTVIMKVYGEDDPDGQITQYRWWYYDVRDPDDQLGVQITNSGSAQLIIGTNGDEGDTITYALGLEVIDNDNLSFNSEDLYGRGNGPQIDVINGPNEAPEAKFNVSATSVFAGDVVTFTSASVDPDGEILAYIWDLEGDGFHNNAPSDSPSVTHIFTEKNLAGVEVKLKIRDDKGGEDISSGIRVYVDVAANPPTAAFISEEGGGEDSRVIKFINNSSPDEEAGVEIISTVWDFDLDVDSDGDGIKDNDVDSHDDNPSHLYPSHGLYKAKLSVVDSQGNSAEITNEIPVGEEMVVIEQTTTELTQNGQNAEVDTVTEDDTEPVTGDDTVPVSDGEDDGIEYGPLGAILPNNTTADNTVVETPIPFPDSNLKAVLETTPDISADGNVYLSGDGASLRFEFAKSEGPIKLYVIDKNINYDSDGNGFADDDWNFVTDIPGTWQTNYSNEWVNLEAKLTVIGEDDEENSFTQKIVFQ